MTNWLRVVAVLWVAQGGVVAGQSEAIMEGAKNEEYRALRFSEEIPVEFSSDRSSRQRGAVRSAQLPTVELGAVRPKESSIGEAIANPDVESLRNVKDGLPGDSRPAQGRRSGAGASRTSTPPNLRMTELTVNTSVVGRVSQNDELDASPEEARFVLTFDTDFINTDLRFSYASRPLGYRHHPLYFEDVALERYGVACGVADPIISAAHFYGNVLILPYKMTVNLPSRPIATYGPRQDFWKVGYFDSRRFPSDSRWRSVAGVSVETLVVSALVLGL
jgi:hypothetical protein